LIIDRPPEDIQESLRKPLTSAEEKLLDAVLNLSARAVQGMMTPRGQVEMLRLQDGADKIFQSLRTFEHRHIPVLGAGAGDVVGILSRDEYLLNCALGQRRDLEPRSLQPPLFVDATQSALELLELFKKYPAPLAVVRDAAGDFCGVVTHLDILEAITGMFPGRHEPYQDAIRRRADESYIMNGAVPMRRLCETLGIALVADSRYTTLGGLILHELGRIAKPGDTLDWNGWRIEVRQMDGRRVSQARMRRMHKLI